MPAKKKTITLDKIYLKLLEHDKRFDAVDERFARQDVRLDNFASQFFEFKDSVDKRFEELLGRIRAIETNLEKLTGDVDKLTQEYYAITAALRRLEKAIGDPENWTSSIREELDSMNARITTLERQVLK